MSSKILGRLHVALRKVHIILHMTTFSHVANLDLVGIGHNVIKTTTDKEISWHNEVHTPWGQFLTSQMMVIKTLKYCPHKVFLTNFDDLHMWCDEPLCQVIFVNLLLSPTIWIFNIWHLLDILTYFWYFDTWLISLYRAIFNNLMTLLYHNMRG